MNLKSLAALILVVSTALLVVASPLTYGLCQTGCNVLAVACYDAASFTFGVSIVAAPPATAGCNAGLGTCMAACAATALVAP